MYISKTIIKINKIYLLFTEEIVFSILNILSIQETNSINSETIKWIIEKSCKIKKNENIIETINYVYHKFYNAKEVGSLLNIEKRSYQETLQFIKSLEKRTKKSAE